MAANYLHGVETVEVERGLRPVRTVKSAVIGLIGTAPIGAVNVSTLTLSEKDAAAFGPQLPGFTIPQALDAIYDHGAGTVIVINVLDPATHKTTVANEAIAFDASTDRVKLAHGAVAALVLKSTDGATTYVAGTDYTADLVTGEIVRIKGGGIVAAGSAKANYDYADPTKVTAADIIGAVNEAGVRTGLKALKDTYNLFGFFAKILIAPAFCTQNSVATELIAMAEQLGETPAPNGEKIGAVIISLSNQFWANMKTCYEAAAEKLGVAIDVQTGTTEGDTQSQLETLMTMADMDYSVIIVSPIDGTNLIPGIVKCNEKGIKVINLGPGVDTAALAEAGGGVVAGFDPPRRQRQHARA